MTTDFIIALKRLEEISHLLSGMTAEKIDEAVRRISVISEFIEKYNDLGIVLEECKRISETLYLCKDMLTIEEAARYMKVTTRQVYIMTGKREVTYYKPMGKVIYISRKDLDEALKRNPVLSNAELERRAIAATMQDADNCKRKVKRTKKGGTV